MAPYNPPTKVKNIDIPFKVLVMRADPAFEASKRREPFYQFSGGRRFDEDTSQHGAYSNAPHDNPPFT